MRRSNLGIVQRVRAELENLPDLPSTIRYIDPYTEQYYSIPSPATNDRWRVHSRGTSEILDLSCFPSSVRELMRRVLAWCLRKYAPTTVVNTCRELLWFVTCSGEEFVLAPFVLSPLDLKHLWHSKVLPALIEDGISAPGLKRFLFYLCEMDLGHLGPGYLDLVSSFPGPKADLYSSIRSADTFLSAGEELTLINYLDDLSESATSTALDPITLRGACILVAAFQHAMRPIQIAKVKTTDVLVRLPNDPVTDGPIVHVRFHREKQADEKDRVAMVRKIRRDWAVLYTQFSAARQAKPSLLIEPGAVDQSFFGLSPSAVSLAIRSLTAELLPCPRNATQLRHTAAQRMADAGASHEELAELLGHNNTRTAILYYRESATQAERVNKALATSKIYSTIVDIHRAKTIDSATLLDLPPDHQIGAVPHGVPIAGIGKCELGQSLCVKNPVLSCYGCRKFLPVRDVKIHKEVCRSLRPVVTHFFQASHGEAGSPAYMQLRRTIEAAEQVITEIDGGARNATEQEF